jgi:hypothetical protein
MKHLTWMLCTVLAVDLAFVASCATDEDPTTTPNPDDPNPDDPDPQPGSLTPQTFITQLVTADCKKAFECKAEYPAMPGDTFEDTYSATEADCVTDDEDVADLAAIEAAVAAGNITFDSAIAENCLANLAFPASCSEFFTTYDYPDSCYDALAGNVADGAACTTDWECGEDSECNTAGVCAIEPEDPTAP